jgi:hypothetical protein
MQRGSGKQRQAWKAHACQHLLPYLMILVAKQSHETRKDQLNTKHAAKE